MSKKDYISIAVSLVIIGVSVFFLIKFISPGKNSQNNNVSQENIRKDFSIDFDTDSLNKVKKLQDYGEAKLDNIGRPNPFAGI